MTLPNFLIIGAAKSGTSSLYDYLGQHPQVYTSPLKGPCYFAFEDGHQVRVNGPGDQELFNRLMVTNFASYQELFSGVTGETAIGEASVLYMYEPSTAARIYAYKPDIKLIACLRNPVDRAFSSYLHLRRDAREPLASFADALRAENDRVCARWEHQWHYTRLGAYHEQLVRYYELFHREQIAVYLYDEFLEDPIGLVQKIYRFLGVDGSFAPDISIRLNVSGKPRSRVLHNFLTKPNPLAASMRKGLPATLRKKLGAQLMALNLDTQRQTLSHDMRHKLTQLYREDILKLELLIQRDLSAWLEPD